MPTDHNLKETIRVHSDPRAEHKLEWGSRAPGVVDLRVFPLGVFFTAQTARAHGVHKERSETPRCESAITPHLCGPSQVCVLNQGF